MPRASNVSEEVWAKAIHAVKVQKMSLRQAAQLYGVHHMSLHRRVRGRYPTSMPQSFDIRAYLSPDDEAEVLGVLREQFLHEKRITSDDIRFVVRAISSHGGKRSIPPEFPPSRWIMDFKRAHGFAKLNSYAYPPTNSTSDQEMEDADDTASNNSSYSMQSYQRDDNENARSTNSAEQNSDADKEELGSFTSNGSYEAGVTTGSSSGGSCESGDTEKRSYKLSHTVPPEVWEKAIAAVEQQGMSLRAAAKMYGVHFAALHRRVKKRAQSEQGSGVEGYFSTDDEAGIIRVVVARAELGVLMTFDELMDLVQRAALRNLPDLSIDAARTLMARFQSRNEHSIRHIISDWPLPRLNNLNQNGTAHAHSTANHAHTQHERSQAPSGKRPFTRPAVDHGSAPPRPPPSTIPSSPESSTHNSEGLPQLPALRVSGFSLPPAFLARAHFQGPRTNPNLRPHTANHDDARPSRERTDRGDSERRQQDDEAMARGEEGVMFV
ncbi:hypothetical protein P43SY_004457 [Pythium insidiosum]|uniref:HTH psq-type domain-containing protein n=1 Tax=Pythium insidiosum TaxID=114742 RepID=A0AAD5QDK3_PYTIN|nr:hypothetical protein P43SY_004457 [Pythium insidiosum]